MSPREKDEALKAIAWAKQQGLLSGPKPKVAAARRPYVKKNSQVTWRELSALLGFTPQYCRAVWRGERNNPALLNALRETALKGQMPRVNKFKPHDKPRI